MKMKKKKRQIEFHQKWILVRTINCLQSPSTHILLMFCFCFRFFSSFLWQISSWNYFIIIAKGKTKRKKKSIESYKASVVRHGFIDWKKNTAEGLSKSSGYEVRWFCIFKMSRSPLSIGYCPFRLLFLILIVADANCFHNLLLIRKNQIYSTNNK